MSINPKGVYDTFYKDTYIPLSETIVRLNMLAAFIERKSCFLDAKKAHMTADDQTGRKENTDQCSIMEWAAQDPVFNAKGLWLTDKQSTDSKDFVPSPYPHFKTFYNLSFAPSAKTKEDATEFHGNFIPLPVFFGLHPAVYKYLMSALNYEYDFGIFRHSIIFWLQQLQIPESYWSKLDLSETHKFFRFGPNDMVKRIRFFISLLEQSPLTSSYEATYELLGYQEWDLERQSKSMSTKIKNFIKKRPALNFLTSFSKSS
jgi:hypothetical protein